MARNPLAVRMAKRIRFFAELAGLSQTRIAQKMKVSDAAVSQWFSGDSMPTHQNLTRLLRLFGTDHNTFWASRLEARAVAE